jgi:hypothetical protein
MPFRNKKAQMKLEKVDNDLKNYKSNSIKVSTEQQVVGRRAPSAEHFFTRKQIDSDIKKVWWSVNFDPTRVPGTRPLNGNLSSSVFSQLFKIYRLFFFCSELY